MPKTFIAVIGAGDASGPIAELAEGVGAAVAEAGRSLVCGGRAGVMEAACRGHHLGRLPTQDVVTMGILPGEAAGAANPYVDIAVPTGLGIARNILVVRSAVGVIAVGGGSGTLSELAFAWQLGLPVVALSPSGGIAAEFAGKSVDSRRPDTVLAASDPREAVSLLVELLRR